jgi:hypothetical protein
MTLKGLQGRSGIRIFRNPPPDDSSGLEIVISKIFFAPRRSRRFPLGFHRRLFAKVEIGILRNCQSWNSKFFDKKICNSKLKKLSHGFFAWSGACSTFTDTIKRWRQSVQFSAFQGVHSESHFSKFWSSGRSRSLPVDPVGTMLISWNFSPTSHYHLQLKNLEFVRNIKVGSIRSKISRSNINFAFFRKSMVSDPPGFLCGLSPGVEAYAVAHDSSLAVDWVTLNKIKVGRPLPEHSKAWGSWWNLACK